METTIKKTSLRCTSILMTLLLTITMIPMTMLSANAVKAQYANGIRYIQSDSKWANYKYGGGTLKATGCGIFSLVNAVYALKGKDMGVTTVAKWAHEIGAYNPGNSSDGTYRDRLYPKVTDKYGSKYGFKIENSGSGYYASASSSTLSKHLKKGGVAIGHVPGHFIALVGYDTGNGKILVYDSYPTNARGTSKNGDWRSPSQFTGKLKLDWFCLLSSTSSTSNPDPTPTPSPSSSYFPKCSSSHTSIVTALNSIGVDSSYSYRSKIAAANGISNYSGTASQNTTMLNKLKAGTLKKPGSTSSVSYFPKCSSSHTSIVTALNSIGVDSSYSYRSKIAAKNGISGYSGTASQNTTMLNKLKAGTLIKP